MQINADALLYVLPLGFQYGKFHSTTCIAHCRYSIMKVTLLFILTEPKRDSHSTVSAPSDFILQLTYCSISGILNNTKTPLGRSLLRTWLSRPSLSIPVITARHDAVAAFLRPENLVTANAIHNHLKGIKNVPRILGSLRSGKARISDWQGIVKVGPFIYSLL